MHGRHRIVDWDGEVRFVNNSKWPVMDTLIFIKIRCSGVAHAENRTSRGGWTGDDAAAFNAPGFADH
jgi:hypothetical protein